MLSVSSMALATMLGSACGTNMANLNNYNAALYNINDGSQIVSCQNGAQDMNSLLSQRGVSLQPGTSVCRINPDCLGGNCRTATCQGNNCITGVCANGFGF